MAHTPMSLQPGVKLGPYETLAPLGAGGMGEVWKARDARLDRLVAVKVLPGHLAGNVEALARFEREAQAVASLNHPSITGIFDVGREGDTTYAVMELLEGESLRARLEQGPLSPRKAVELAIQMAQGLAAAHERGVVHRDLKPDNLWITKDGRLKILDFGLARQIQAPGGGSDSFVPTEAIRHEHQTEKGTILGTLGYMSPEQVRGQTADARSDLFSFGVVLFEMLTGRKAFARSTASETMAAILRDDPPELEETARPVPLALRRIVDHCLEKEPAHRFRDAHDVAFALEALSVSSPGSAPILTPFAPQNRRITLFWAAVASALIVAGAAGARLWFGWAARGPSGMPIGNKLTRITSDSGLTVDPAVSPNGALLVYASDRGGANLNLWVQPLPEGEPVEVTHDDTDAREPSFSPDGSRIAFRSERAGGGIYVVPALGGTERLVAAKGRRPRYAPDGRRIAFRTGGRGSRSEAWVVDEAGGAPLRLAQELFLASDPAWSPDGSAVVVVGAQTAADARDWFRVDVSSGAATPLRVAEVLKPAGVPVASVGLWLPGEIVFSANSGDSASLWSLGVSDDGRSVRGPLRRLTAGTGLDRSPTIATDREGRHLFFASLDSRVNLYRLPVAANEGRATGDPKPLTDSAAHDFWPSVSSDGRTLVFASNRRAAVGAWAMSLETHREDPVGAIAFSVVVSPDGQRIAYQTAAPGEKRLAVRPVGGGTVQSFPLDPAWLWDWPVPSLLITGGVGRDGSMLHAFDLTTGKLRPLLAGARGQFYGHGRLSPDGHWMSAMEWTSAGRSRLVVFPFRDTPVPPEELVVVSDEDFVAEENAWSPDGRLLYFVSERDGRRCIWSRRLDPRTGQPLGPPTAVLHLHGSQQSMVSTAIEPARLALGRDELIFGMQLQRGNVWRATLAPRQ